MFHKMEHLADLPDFLAFMPHADSAPGTCIPQREEAISLRHTGQSRLSRDHEEARRHRPPEPGAFHGTQETVKRERDRVSPT
jgi:hypothetical protein